MKAGDYVLIQMGHNDGGDLGGSKPRVLVANMLGVTKRAMRTMLFAAPASVNHC
jgi:rhamnogalacturonan acetylesterase